MKVAMIVWAMVGSVLAGMMVMFGYQIQAPMASAAGAYFSLTCWFMLWRAVCE